jgi:hypothetical protein
MDPLYDYHYCDDGNCYSALDFHNLQTSQNSRASLQVTKTLPAKQYLDLFYDVQVVMANDFFSNPLNSVGDIITREFYTLRWIDESTPPYNRVALAGGLFLYYYVPKISQRAITFYKGIPLSVVMIIILFFIIRNKNRNGKQGASN